jgi:peroxiredoxin
MRAPFSLLKRMSDQVAKKAKLDETVRSITIGTDMISSVISLQKARPWFNSDSEGSNLAKDNEMKLKELFEGKTVALFGIPAPFTGVCTNAHYPPYKAKADEFKEAGADKLVCYSVTDPYAHYNWAKSLGNDFDKIDFLADEDSSFAKAYGLELDCKGVSLGMRARRFSMIVEDGTVKVFHEVEDADKDAEILLADLKELKDE